MLNKMYSSLHNTWGNHHHIIITMSINMIELTMSININELWQCTLTFWILFCRRRKATGKQSTEQDEKEEALHHWRHYWIDREGRAAVFNAATCSWIQLSHPYIWNETERKKKLLQYNGLPLCYRWHSRRERERGRESTITRLQFVYPF